MHETTTRIATLITKYKQDTLTGQEETELNEWINSSARNKAIFHQITQGSVVEEIDQVDLESEWDITVAEYHEKANKKRPVTNWSWLAIAASLIGCILAGGNVVNQFTSNPERIASRPPISNDKLTLISANGQKFVFDGLKKAMVIRFGDIEVWKENDSHIVIKAFTASGFSEKAAQEASLQSINTGERTRCLVTLPDGSDVTLFASSSLTRIDGFTTGNRSITLTGRAFFEVIRKRSPATDGLLPFSVTANGAKIHVLGTKFDVSTSLTNASIKVALVEGKVRVEKGNCSNELKPGQQAQVSTNGQINIIDNIDTSSYTAIKRGKFAYKNAPLEEIMDDISRWYGVEVIHTARISGNFKLDLPCTVPYSKILEILEKTTTVRFHEEEGKIYIMK
jgi:transmembrane sensor